MEEFLNQGNNVDEIPRGVSSRDGADKPLRADTWQMDNSKGNWTYLPGVVDSLEMLRLSKSAKTGTSKNTDFSSGTPAGGLQSGTLGPGKWLPSYI